MTTSSLPPILYVEDEEDDVVLVKMAFRHAAIHHRLDVAPDGRQALEHLFGRLPGAEQNRHPPPCLVLLDLNLPQLNGLEVLQRIRQEPRFARLPVIIFSSSEQNTDRQRAHELGANDYVVKPSTMEGLTAFARKLKDQWLSPRVSISPAPG
jgi:CheY-like chemotaxis protein